MKRILLLVACLGLVALPAAAQHRLTVGIDQGTQAEWTAIVDSFETERGVSVQLRSYPQATIAQQIVLQGFSRSGELHLVMVPRTWGTSLARYLEDLSDVEASLSGRGVDPVYISDRPVGVPLPFAPDWFLGVLSWPDDPELAVQFLIHAAATTGASTAAVAAPMSIQAAVTTFAKQKLPAAEHNPVLDGSLEVLLGAVRASSTAIASATSVARAALAGLASQFGVPFSSSAGTITVVLESSPGRSSASTASALTALGVSRSAIETTPTLVKATVSLSQLPDLARQLTGVAFIRPPYTPFPLATTGQGIAAIGANAFHASGFDGSGVRIAIIDLGFAGLSQAQGRGDLPYSLQQNDLTGTGLTTGITHGTAVAEIVHEVAPGAELHLIKIADEVDLDGAVTYCLSRGIDIINHSLGWYNTNFYDGTGTIADIARRAISGGILWVNAAGNEAESHWEGTFTDGNSDGSHDQIITLYASSGSQIVLFLTWNDWPKASSDYDLYLYGPASEVIASSTKYQTGTEEPTESIQVSAPTSGTYTIRIQGSNYKSLELYSLYHSVSPVVASSSILAPANVAEVVAVGAIDHASYTVGPLEPYSSQGPTNDGRTKPDLCAPDKVTTGTSQYTTFYGTSGAAPHAAGAAALLLDQDPGLGESALRARLLSQTVAMGSPNLYGNGRLALQPPATANQPPTAAFTFSPTGPTVGTPVTFNGSGSSDADGAIVSYAWSFGDGATGSGISPTHAYSAPGTYDARLTVTDDDGATDTRTRSLSVSPAANQPPTAAFTASPTTAQPNEWISFDGSGSNDPDGTITSYAWTFGDGTTGTGTTTFHRYTSPGTYTVRLTVTDDDAATASATRQITVQTAAAPDLTVTSLTFSPSGPTIGQTVTFTFTVRNAGTASAGSFRVRLQGSASSTQAYIGSLAAGVSRTSSLTLPLTGSTETFTVTADDLGQVSESNEGNNTRSVTVNASTPPPVADAGGPYSGTAGQSIPFNGSGSSGSITSYSWTFGDGGSATGVSPSHTYGSAGTYTATLTVYGPGGQSSDSASVSVAQPQPGLTAQLSLSRSTYTVGEAITVTFTTNRTAYVYLCDVSADGRVTLMRPNWMEPANPLPAGSHTVPGSGYTLRITEPIGTETLLLFAATNPLPQFPTSFGAGFPLLSTNPSSFRNSVLATMQSQLPSGDWAYDTLSFQVVEPAPQTGTLRVETTPSGATVRIDGTHVGTSPVERSGLIPGSHSVRVSRSGYQTSTQTATVTAGTTTTVRITLTPEVSNTPPIADFAYTPPGPAVDAAVTFNASSSYDPDGSIASYAWTFGDGGTASGPIVSHTYTSEGTRNVRLTVTDNQGATDTMTRSVAVSSLEDVGWITPVATEDPARNWQFDERAFDDDIHSVAAYLLERSGWSSYLFFETQEGGLLSDGIRLLVYDNYRHGNALKWDVDVHRDGEWINVFDGQIEESEWRQVPFDEGTVTEARIRAYLTRSGDIAAYIQEVDFHDATVPSP